MRNHHEPRNVTQPANRTDKYAAMRILLILGLLVLAGCGAPAPAGQTSLYSWKDDGNPLVLPCKTKLTDCKSAIQFQDMTSGGFIFRRLLIAGGWGNVYRHPSWR